MKNLKEQSCEPCRGGIAALSNEQVNEYLAHIHDGWLFHQDQQLIKRQFKFKNFSKTMFFVNALAHLADQEGHHPDVEFGYNYCHVSLTTHEAKGLTINDFICAKKVDLLI